MLSVFCPSFLRSSSVCADTAAYSKTSMVTADTMSCIDVSRDAGGLSPQTLASWYSQCACRGGQLNIFWTGLQELGFERRAPISFFPPLGENLFRCLFPASPTSPSFGAG